jgi:hypothetical protein
MWTCHSSHYEVYCHVMCVTIDGVRIGDSMYWPLIHSRLVTKLYRSLTHRLMSSVYCSLH